MAGCALIGALVLNSLLSTRSLEHDKSALLAKQRALQVTVGPQWTSLQTIIAGQVTRLGSPEYPGDFVDPESRSWSLASEIGLYLRIPELSRASASLPEVAADSKIDALATCLVNGRATAHRSEDAGGVPASPVWNVGDLYSRLSVLNDRWVERVNAAPGDLELRSLRFQYEEHEHRELPQAADILQRAGFLLVAIDEGAPAADASSVGSPAEPPYTRISLYDLRANRERLRMRARGEAVLFSVGEHTLAGLAAQSSAQKQANSCNLAGQITRRLKGSDGAAR